MTTPLIQYNTIVILTVIIIIIIIIINYMDYGIQRFNVSFIKALQKSFTMTLQ